MLSIKGIQRRLQRTTEKERSELIFWIKSERVEGVHMLL